MSQHNKRQRLVGYHNQPGGYQGFHDPNHGAFTRAPHNPHHMIPLFVDTAPNNGQGQSGWGMQHAMSSPQPHGANMSPLSPNGTHNNLMGANKTIFSSALIPQPHLSDERHNKYCHFCQHHKVKKSSSMNACTNPGCIRRFCGHCLKVHLQDSAANTNRDGTPAARPGSANWTCPICRKACCCAKDVCTIDHRHCKTYRYRRRRKDPRPTPAPATAPDTSSPGVEAAGAMASSEARVQEEEEEEERFVGAEGSVEFQHASTGEGGKESAAEGGQSAWGFGGRGVTLGEGMASTCGVGPGGECYGKTQSSATPPTATHGLGGQAKMLQAGEMAMVKESAVEEWEAPVKDHLGMLGRALLKEASGEDWAQALREHHGVLLNTACHPHHQHAPPTHGQGLMSVIDGKGGYNGNGNFPLDGAVGVFGEAVLEDADSSRDAWAMAKNDEPEDAWGVTACHSPTLGGPELQAHHAFQHALPLHASLHGRS